MRNLPYQGNPAYQGKKMATPGELHQLHNHPEKIPGGTRTGIGRQYDKIIISPANGGSWFRQQPLLEKFSLKPKRSRTAIPRASYVIRVPVPS